MPHPVTILQIAPFPAEVSRLIEAEFDLLTLADRAVAAEFVPRNRRADIQGIVCTSRGPVDANLIASLPNLEIIACHSAGIEGIDVFAARRRGIKITNTSSVLAEDVADVALALLVGVARRLPSADRFVRAGNWHSSEFPLGRSVTGARVGIVGLGVIGRAIARRLSAFGCLVGYFGPRAKPDAPYPFFADLHDLATWARALVISCPGGPPTRHLINAAVLDRLGPDGWLINIARGSVVEEAALVDALQSNRIAGAGLDVFEHEPRVPDRLLKSERVFLLPHIASATVDTRAGMARALLEELRGHFAKAAR